MLLLGPWQCSRPRPCNCVAAADAVDHAFNGVAGPGRQSLNVGPVKHHLSYTDEHQGVLSPQIQRQAEVSPFPGAGAAVRSWSGHNWGRCNSLLPVSQQQMLLDHPSMIVSERKGACQFRSVFNTRRAHSMQVAACHVFHAMQTC